MSVVKAVPLLARGGGALRELWEVPTANTLRRLRASTPSAASTIGPMSNSRNSCALAR